MLDEKLSRGVTRDLLRKIKQVADFEKGPLLPVLAHLTRLYTRSGGPPNVVSAGLALRDQLVAAGPFPTTALIVKHPTRKRVIVESIRPVVVDGAEQEWLVCAATVYDLGRHELMMVETSGHVGISQHALVRLYQRSDFRDGDIVSLLDISTAFVAPLIQAGVRLNWRPGREVAVPFQGGLLLGSLQANFHEPGQGPSYHTVSRAGVSDMVMLDCPYLVDEGHRCTLKIGISTYIGTRELFPDQRAIFEDLTAFYEHFRSEMHAIRTNMLRGYPDHRMVARFGPVSDHLTLDELEKLGQTMQRFFDTPEWKQHAAAHRKPQRFIQ